MLFENHNPLNASKEGGKNLVAEGNVFQILDIEGKPNEAALHEAFRKPAEELSDIFVKQLYEEMVFIRAADDKFLKLQRQGRMGTYPAIKGQEACQVPVAHALEKQDWVVPAFRETAIMHFHGVPLHQIFQYWGGFEIGSKMPDGVNVLPVSIPVGTHMLHAVGIAWAAKMRSEKTVAVPYFSDGATSEGDFHEAMNLASVFKTATVFFCQNNQYAISTPRVKQTVSKTIAQKAAAYQMLGMQVDGNDALAVFAVAREAVTRARNGEGPFLIEAITYRQGDHTTADDATKYRSKEEDAHWAARDPIVRMRGYLATRNLWNEAWQKEIEERATAKIQEAVALYEATPLPPSSKVFEHIYAEKPVHLREQEAELKRFF